MFNLFIGIIIGTIAYFGNIDIAIGLALFMLIFNPRIKFVIKRPEQQVQTLEVVVTEQQVEKYSDSIIGTFMNNPIHSFIIIKNQSSGICYRYDYYDVDRGGRCTSPTTDGDVRLSTGLVYRNSGTVFSN